MKCRECEKNFIANEPKPTLICKQGHGYHESCYNKLRGCFLSNYDGKCFVCMDYVKIKPGVSKPINDKDVSPVQSASPLSDSVNVTSKVAVNQLG